MLKYRILTAVILIPLVLLAIYYLPVTPFAIISGIIFLACAWEWASITNLKKDNFERIAFLVSVAMVGIIIYLLPLFWILLLSILVWLACFVLIHRYNQQQSFPAWGFWKMALLGWLVLTPSWLAINVARAIGGSASELLWLFLIVWGADTGAYFAGRFFGKNLLMPNVSPKKTWEGFKGGAAAVLLLLVVDGALNHMSWWMWLRHVLLFYVTFIFAVYGDLFESMIKRVYKVKDSGAILPGHGGLLDRLDSLFAAAPVYVFGLLLLSIWS